MVCSAICAPAITILAWLSDLLGLSPGVTGIFIGALVVWGSEEQIKWFNRIAKRRGKKQLFPLQTPIVILSNLGIIAFTVEYLRLI